MVNRPSKHAVGNQDAHPALYAEADPADIQMLRRPVFLVGAERSGTMLLRLMLDHHPHIAFGSGFDYSIYGLDSHGRLMNLVDYYRWIQTDRNFLAQRPRIDRRLTYHQLVNSFLKQFQRDSQKPTIGATIHTHFDRLLQIWPEASFIHIVRDGRDVSRSCMAMGWAGDGWHGAERWIKAEKLWDKVTQQVPEHRRYEVRFESLIEDTVNTLDGVCQFMGHRYHPDMMDYAKDSGYSLPDGRLVNQWHHKLSKREIQLIEARIAPMLVDRGYALSGLPHLRVSPMGRLTLKVQNKLGILSRRARRYGLPLTSADFIARKLRLSRLSDRIRRKINLIDMNTLEKSW